MYDIVVYIHDLHCVDYSDFPELGLKLRKIDILWEQEFQEYVDFQEFMEYLATSSTHELEERLHWINYYDKYSQGYDPEEFAVYIEKRFIEHEIRKRNALTANWQENGF